MDAPSLGSLLPSKVLQYLQRVASAITTTEGNIDKLSKAGFITGKQVQSNVDPTFLRGALQANGVAPLNVTNLLGKLAQPQLAGVPQVTSLPPFNSPVSQDGALVRFNGLLYFFDQSIDPGTWKPVTGVGVVLTGTHAQRISATYTPPTLYPTGSIFYETDRRLLYIVQGGFWEYLQGTFALTQAGIAALTATLTVHDLGLLINVTDFAHILQWSGTVWGWGPGELGSGYFQDFAVAPTGAGWHLCDGAFVGYLKADGTVGTLTLPNVGAILGGGYRKNSLAYAPALLPITVPTVAGSTATTDLHPGFTLVTGGAAVNAVTAFDNPHSHTISPATVTVTVPGDPIANFSAVTYFRQ